MDTFSLLALTRQAPRRSQPLRKIVVITGASTGIGLETVRRLLLCPNYLVVATARESSMGRFATEGLTEGGNLLLRPLDVTSEPERRALVRELDQLGGIDVLINNAGISYRSVMEHVTLAEQRHQLEVNFLAPLALARLVAPSMRNKGRGHIINISSAGGMMAMPTMGVYAASKFALEGASEALYYELKPFGVHVSLVLPGFVSSDAIEKVRLTGKSLRASTSTLDAYYHHYAEMSGFIGKWSRRTRATPQLVAKRIAKVIARPPFKLRIPATIDTHLLWWFRRYSPQRLYHSLLYRLLPNIRLWGIPRLPAKRDQSIGPSPALRKAK